MASEGERARGVDRTQTRNHCKRLDAEYSCDSSNECAMYGEMCALRGQGTRSIQENG